MESNGTPEISIIVPVYNVYEWLDKCLESIVNQTFPEFEIILINDGSLDGSDIKCEEWEKKEPRIVYISKENEGLALTRNRGLSLARGKYIVFVDSDDWLERDFLEKLYNKITKENADFAECDFWRFNSNTNQKTYRACYGRAGKEYSLEERIVYGQSTAWKYMTRKSLWDDNNIIFPNCLSASQGIYALLLLACKRVVSVHEPLYNYRRFRKGSILEENGKKEGENGRLGLEALDYLLKEFENRNLFEKNKKMLERLVKYRLSDLLAAQFNRRNADEFEELASNYYAYVDKYFQGTSNFKYITLGGYNLNRILLHMDCIHNPQFRFNFSSVISIMNKVEEQENFTHKNKYRDVMIKRDMYSTFWDMLKSQDIKYVFIDFIEERHDLLFGKSSYVTKSDAHEEIIEKFDGYKLISRDSKEMQILWEENCKTFIEEITKYINRENIILVKTFLSEKVGDVKLQEYFLDLDAIREKNEILGKYYDFFEENCSGIKVVNVKETELYFTDVEYEYGAIPSHLNDVVNRQIAKQIEKVI